MKEGKIIKLFSRERIFLGLNLFLLILIIFFLFEIFYHPRVTIECAYGAGAEKLLGLVSKRFGYQEETGCFFIFNGLPTLEKLELIEKLWIKFSPQIKLWTFFNRRFRLAQSLPFGYSFIRERFVFNGQLTGKERFLIVKKGNIVHCSSFYSLEEMLTLINSQLALGKSFSPVNQEEEKQRLALLLKKELKMFNLRTGKEEIVNLKQKNNLTVVHASCSLCELRNLISELNRADSRKRIFIISFWASKWKLLTVLQKTHFQAELYLDHLDQLELAFRPPFKYNFFIEEDEKK